MIRKATLAGALAVLLCICAHADDTVPATPPANAQFAADGSVGEVHDGQYLDLSLPQDRWTVQASTAAEQRLTWPVFIREVLAANLDYAAARYNVDMAAADAAAARLLPNPTLSLSGDRDLSYHDKYATGTDGNPAPLRQVESRSIGVDQTIEWYGKRKWRIKVADQTLRAAAATLDDFLRNLKLEEDGDGFGGGDILDPESGSVYRCLLHVEGEGRRLNVRGYIGLSLFGRSQTWLREE